jgi:glycosyltransferase involved in cell wall biosynthesis
VVWHIRDRIAADYLPRKAASAVRLAATLLPRAIIVDSVTVRRTLPRLAPVVQIPSSVPDVEVGTRQRGPDAPFRAVIVGRLSPWKGQELFLDAFRAAFAEGDEEAVLVGGALFGEEPFEAMLRERVASELPGRVTMTGHLEDIGPQLREADVVVHASRLPEPFGLIILEAMSAGVPVIAADTGGPAEVIEHGTDGLLYPVGSVEGLAAALRRLRADPELLRRLTEGGRARAADYRPEVLAPRVADLYDLLLSPPEGGKHRPRVPISLRYVVRRIRCHLRGRTRVRARVRPTPG